ncbi:MAG: aminoacyl-tRNA hydrolase [Gammaproteobacteria bacterium]|nr:aminoacyl-tRNA hydrolase [Gammaproteobacteria bacterium]
MAERIDLIVGLGNPGAEYERTRHNVGFWFVDRLAAQAGTAFRREAKFHGHACQTKLAGGTLHLLKPSTFMNRSGTAVAAASRYLKIEPAAILVVHDDLDLAPGTARLKRGGGHGGHNGLRDITGQIGADFARLRLGIGHPGHAREVVNYVLEPPRAEERDPIDDAIDRALAEIARIVDGEFDIVMNTLNRRAS